MMNATFSNDPIALFQAWFAAAKETSNIDPTAMVLATATKDGKPSARVVLLKAFDARGFTFYTNLGSHKARELIDNPLAALCFYWPTSNHQVRIEGVVELVTATEADEYFASRPRESQIGAWASYQSQQLSAQDELMQRFEAFQRRFEGQTVPRPEFWSGFRLKPQTMEFWEAGSHRLHTRICYHKNAQGQWQIELLYP